MGKLYGSHSKLNTFDVYALMFMDMNRGGGGGGRVIPFFHQTRELIREITVSNKALHR